MGRWEEEEYERKKLLKNICEYNYIIDVPQISQTITPMVERNVNNTSSFLPKLTGGGNSKPTEYTSMKKRGGQSGGGFTQGGATMTGPFYKKRGYASSQLEMRRETS